MATAPAPGRVCRLAPVPAAAGISRNFSLLPVKLNETSETSQPRQVVAARSGETASDSSSSPVDLDLSADIFSEFAA
jgi:hypothetical protein